LGDRLTVTPEPGEDRYAAITGDGTFTKILAEIVFPKGAASPAGFDTCGMRKTRIIRAA
jgi:predicted methyltransferase